MNTLYLYVTKEEYENCLKYGIKLSEFANTTIEIDTVVKKCITAYLAPKDSDKYFDENFVCLKVSPENLKIYIQNQIFDAKSNEKINSICDINSYKIGQFEKPIALICTTILPENILLYNKIIDTPLFADNSRDLFYLKSTDEIIENCNFSNEELYKAIFQLADSKGKYEKFIDEPNLKVLIDKKNNKLYTNVIDT